MSELGCVCDCASLCPPMVFKCLSQPPPSMHSSLAARTWQDLGSWVGPGLGLVGGYGRGGRPGRWPLQPHSRLKQRGQGSPSSHPSDLCVRCLPAHPRGAARDAASLPGQPQARRSGSQGPVTSHLSRGCKELPDELQHARTQEADRLVPRPRVIVEV